MNRHTYLSVPQDDGSLKTPEREMLSSWQKERNTLQGGVAAMRSSIMFICLQLCSLHELCLFSTLLHFVQCYVKHFLLKILISLCVPECMCVRQVRAGALRSQKRASDLLELELEAVVSPSPIAAMWVLGN